jgi:hypothetical protein
MTFAEWWEKATLLDVYERPEVAYLAWNAALENADATIAARRDAERYRWLINNADEIYIMTRRGGVNLHLESHYIGVEKMHANADAEIDAAMAEKKPE